MNNLLIQHVQVVSWPHSLDTMLWNLGFTNCRNPHIKELPPQAGTGGARHDGCIAASAPLLTLMRPSLWNRENLDSSDHMVFFQSLCSLANSSIFSRLASLISGFLQATQLFSPNLLTSLCIVHVEMLLLSLLYTALRSTGVFPQFDFSKCDLQARSFRIFSRPHLFLEASPISFWVSVICWSVLNPILAVYAFVLCFMHANNFILLNATIYFPQTQDVSFDWFKKYEDTHWNTRPFIVSVEFASWNKIALAQVSNRRLLPICLVKWTWQLLFSQAVYNHSD